MEWGSHIQEVIRAVTDSHHRDHLQEAYQVAMRHSDDDRTKTGAVLVEPNSQEAFAYGANHFPRGLTPTPEQSADRAWRLENIIHAEPAVIHEAARLGRKTDGAIMYMPWVPCYPCAKAIIDSGVKTLIGHQAMILMTPEDWWADINKALIRLKEADVDLLMYVGPIGGVDALFRGRSWKP